MLENAKLNRTSTTRTGSYCLSWNPDEGINSAVLAFESGGHGNAMEKCAKQGYEVDAFDPNDTASYREAPSNLSYLVC